MSIGTFVGICNLPGGYSKMFTAERQDHGMTRPAQSLQRWLQATSPARLICSSIDIANYSSWGDKTKTFMTSLRVEKELEKAKSVFITEDEPAFIFLFNTIDEANNAFLQLTQLFGTKAVTLHINYNQRFLNFTLIDEATAEMVNANNVPFDNPYHFRLVKALSNLVSGTDVMGKKLNKDLQILLGVRTNVGGFRTAHIQGIDKGFGSIKKFTTNLIHEL